MEKIDIGQISEKELIDGIKESNEQAFNELYSRFWYPLFRTSYSIIRDEELARDVIQDIFTQLWIRRSELEIQNIKAYLKQSTKLKCFEFLRRKNIDTEVLDRFKQVAFTYNTELEISFQEVKKHYEESLSSIPEKSQTVFKLSRIENLSNKEIASKLNISHKTVEYHISNALKHLRLALTDFLAIIILFF